MQRKTIVFAFAGWWLAAAEAAAYRPPVDSAGPLRVRIDGPSEVTRTETPFPVKVLFENRSEVRVSGAVRLRVTDRWRAEPSQPVRFAVEGMGSARLDFNVVAGEGTYNGHYPIHATAEYEIRGKKLAAHPVLVVETRLQDPPRPLASIEWREVEVGVDRALALWRLPVVRAVLQVFGEEPRVMPAGWVGSDGRTRASVTSGDYELGGDSRSGVGLHPPWFGGGAGTVLVEFPLRLPPGASRLSFATAIREHHAAAGEPPSDGVTFRVRVLPFDAPPGSAGEKVFEHHSDAKVWREAEVDLSRFAGRAIRLQLESHPGPKADTTCDQSYWAEPTLVSGSPPGPAPFPPDGGASSMRLGSLEVGGERYDIRCWPGSRGLLDATVGFERRGKRLLFRGFEVRVLGDALQDRRSLSELVEAKLERIERGLRARHRFRSWAGSFDLLAELSVERNALRGRFWLESAPQPAPWLVAYIEDVAAGPWSERAERVYAGPGNVIQNPEPFQLGFDGHRLATSFVGFDFANGVAMLQGVDVPPERLEVRPQAGRYALHAPHAQTLTFVPSRNVWEAVKVWRMINGLKAAGGVKELAGRFVFDLWGGRYGPSAEALGRAFRYGLTDAVVIWHNWQRWGYDYRLPDIYPPNPDLGTFEEFRELVRVSREHGVLFAPHDNYIDYYPDARGYSYEHVAFTRNRRPVRAWLNKWRGAQSYRWRPDRVRPFVERNLKLIREGFRPSAYFIDVWSSIGPYDYWSEDGRFYDRIFTRRIWGETFAWIRDYLGDRAPQISESGHDQLIGWLDGAQANHLRVGARPEGAYSWAVWPIRCADAERIPWFDAAHHDRFVLHGAGYESRYRGGLDAELHGIYSDDYITTEVLTGHPAMVSAPFGRDAVRKYWLLHDLMRALALRKIETVEFVEGDLHRQRILWDSGAEVWVNRGRTDWRAEGHDLPPFGFYARAPAVEASVEAAIERRQGVIVEWSRSPQSFYVNARPVLRERRPVRVAVESLRLAGGRSLELTLRWEARQPLSRPLQIFVHFVDRDGEIRFQGDHRPPRPTTEWRGTVHSSTRAEIPAEFSAGSEFELRAGLYHPGGSRVRIDGPDDGSSRIRLGTLRLEGDGAGLSSVSWTPYLRLAPDPVLARLNPQRKPIDFGALTTDGACRLQSEEAGLRIVPLPESPQFTVRWRRGDLPQNLAKPPRAEALDGEGEVLRSVSVELEAGYAELTCELSVFAYRLPVK